MANIRSCSTKTAAAMSENGRLNGHRTSMRNQITESIPKVSAFGTKNIFQPGESMSIATLSSEWAPRLKKLAHDRVFYILTFSLLAISGCSSPAPKNAGASLPPSTSKNATITADPNPIQVCDGSGTGITKLNWTSVGPALVEVHVNSPNGDLLARTGANGTASTGKWVL